MNKLSLTAVALLLAACNTTQGPPAATSTPAPATKTSSAKGATPAKAEEPAGGGVMSSLSALAGAATSGGSGATSRENKVGAGLDVLKAVTVSDGDLKNVSSQMRAREDKKGLAPAGDAAVKRLARLTAKHLNEDGLTLNFKVYRSAQVNANATADGSIRFYTGLMAMMSDQEVLGVIGHEIGHVKLGHTMSAMRTAYMASAGRKAAAASSGIVGALADSDLGAIGEALVNSQFSQSQETESDDYGLAFMKKHGYDTKAMASALGKIASLSGKSSGGLGEMLSSHPEPGKRAERMREKVAKL